MQLEATLGMWARGERVRKAASFWDRVRKVLGPARAAGPDEVQTMLSAAALVGGAAQALDQLGVTDAIALVVDGQVVYEDRQGRPDDLEALLAALGERPASAMLNTLELAVEHRAGGLHYLVVLSARGVHATDEATGQVAVSARSEALAPAPGELDLDYVERVTRAFASAAPVEALVGSFRDFAARLAAALAEALPEVRLGAPSIEVSLRRPDPASPAGPRDEAPASPYDRYCPEPRQALIDETLWSLVRRWPWSPPWSVIDPAGRKIGSLAAFAAETPLTEPFAPADPWSWDAWAGDWAASGVEPDGGGS
ncbi:MAG: hypothetical protein U1F43_10505 [Myxococcota bacterium]